MQEMISRSLSIKALQKNLLLLTLIGYANLMLQNNSEALEDLNKSIRKGTNFGDANGFRVMIKSKNIEYYGVDDICRKHLGLVALFLERDTGVSYILSFVTK